MVDQATMKTTNGRTGNGAEGGGTRIATDRPQADGESRPGASTVASSVAGFGENLFNLAELQSQMFASELRRDAELAKTGGVGIVVGLALAASALVLALAGVAELLVSELGLKRGIALLLVSAGAALLGGLCVAAGKARLGPRWFTFPASGEELSRNLNWVRTVLRHSGRFSARR
jgi:Putative Actinobacterial Holin-X, holin superfamily III